MNPAGAVQLRNELTSSFAVELPPTATFDYPTPASLATFIAGQTAAAAGAEAFQADIEPAVAASQEQPRDGEPAPAVAAAGSGVQDIVAEVASIVASVLGAEIATDEPLMAAGLDSLGAEAGGHLLCFERMLDVCSEALLTIKLCCDPAVLPQVLFNCVMLSLSALEWSCPQLLH